MALATDSELREVHGIDDAQRAAIKAFVQGAVYSWVKNRKGETFAVRDLVGGDNKDWTGTPLYALYAKHIGQGKGGEEAGEAAARDLGWLVKSVLAEDKRTFEATKAGLVSAYRWVEVATEDLDDHAEREWDEQIERDERAGRLDALIDRALEEHRAGRTRPL